MLVRFQVITFSLVSAHLAEADTISTVEISATAVRTGYAGNIPMQSPNKSLRSIRAVVCLVTRIQVLAKMSFAAENNSAAALLVRNFAQGGEKVSQLVPGVETSHNSKGYTVTQNRCSIPSSIHIFSGMCYSYCLWERFNSSVCRSSFNLTKRKNSLTEFRPSQRPTDLIPIPVLAPSNILMTKNQRKLPASTWMKTVTTTQDFEITYLRQSGTSLMCHS